ncbi:hypothetical protein BSL78_27877 [Apostichopus japonicus]|uniref:Uncharacterized protein n=1 Tax=Stichopus japonicus TaxID=307972 RepID=A0A2G8JHS0_STIJA|nr:hypothetical protein BSL78_27877 [Apostichopus japonicus]
MARPDVKSLSLPGESSNDPLGLSTLRADEGIRGGSALPSSVGAGSSGRSNGPKHRTNLLTSGLVSSPDSELSNSSPLDDSFEQGHSRTSSYNSQQSKGSGSSSSNTSSNQEKSSSVTSLTEQTSDKEGATSSSRDSWRGTAERRRKHAEETQKTRRVDDTRVDADEVIQGLISQQDFTESSQATTGLQLYVAKDGSTALGSNHLKDRMSAGTFQQVVIDKR